MNNNKIPPFLYRGVVIDCDNLPNFKIHNADLLPYGNPIIDKNGRKLIGDGNEFGIYMTDNQNMVYSAYGNPRNTGTIITPNITISRQLIKVPNVGISYKINTLGLDIRKPWITSALRDVYNNGFAGSEYVTDMIPARNYQVTRIRIADDYLHDMEDINVSDISKADVETRHKIEVRKYRLLSFINAISNIPAFKRDLFGYQEKNLFRDIFGENGVRYADINDINVSNVDGIIRYLLFINYHSNPNNMNLKKLLYIESIREKVAKYPASGIDILIKVVSSDLDKNINVRNLFVGSQPQLGEAANTRVKDDKYIMIEEILNQLQYLQKKKINYSQLLNQQDTENIIDSSGKIK